MLDARRLRKILSFVLLGAAVLPLAARADIEITLSNSFIEKFKNRATIDATFTVDKAHPRPNPASKDGDLHAAGRAPEVGLPMVAEVMNARSEPAALDLIHQAEQSRQALPVRGIWRLWCEHGGDVAFKQFTPLDRFDTTNPPHVFQIHPLLQVGDQALGESLKPIDGFTYKEAGQAFHAYENLSSHITTGGGQTTLRTTMAGFNYVEFILQLNEEPTHTIDDGLTVMASILDLHSELLVRNRRMVFAQGTAPFERVRALHKGDALHVVGVPRISLALLSYRVAQRNKKPGILDWSLPYEIVVVATFDDTPAPEEAAAGAAPGGGTAPPPPPPAPVAKTESEAIQALAGMVNACRGSDPASGACAFVAGSKMYCAVVSRAECDQLGGTWHAGAACP